MKVPQYLMLIIICWLTLEHFLVLHESDYFTFDHVTTAVAVIGRFSIIIGVLWWGGFWK